VRAVELSADGRTLFLAIDGMAPVMQMRVAFDCYAADGGLVRGAAQW